ncbi:hypothetical protein CC1G_02166 [Coprinopsis cinerea okayama7|uniref:Uncharacterized protein n=1 Tax=Coprinopsis cinerea (strain Okayama-7 / 130 / ATCC MYA-4618 / FGSC 9003) TaxID=240176 RepID=A8NKF0_COPC7|nr:hypothetical protein CC1G_02166 [Coprinopsis cinerea okayama7\|eukprot:XP_001834430.2 hypothetical protein CC1G_02166 [Coprinopsis cinerea okayama7\
MSIPNSSFSPVEGVGSHSFPDFAASLPHQQVLLAMSDAMGLATGGTSDVLVVAPAESSELGCHDAVSSGWSVANFTLDVSELQLSQCREMPFSSRPVVVTGFVPNGGAVFRVWPQSSNPLRRKIRLPAGTQVAVFATDADGRDSGVTRLLEVTDSGDDSCLGVLHTDGKGKEKRFPTGAIAGAAAGGVAILAILAFSFLRLMRRRKSAQNPQVPDRPVIDIDPEDDWVDAGRVASLSPNQDALPPTVARAKEVLSWNEDTERAREEINPFASPDDRDMGTDAPPASASPAPSYDSTPYDHRYTPRQLQNVTPIQQEVNSMNSVDESLPEYSETQPELPIRPVREISEIPPPIGIPSLTQK